MGVSNLTLLLAGFWLLVVVTERVAHTAAASRADQYQARHEPPAAPSLRREATDHQHSHENVLELNANPDRNHDNDRIKLSLIADRTKDDEQRNKNDDQTMHTNELGEMQVGCGQGLFEVVPAPKSLELNYKNSKKSKNLRRRRRSIEKQKERKRRNYHGTFTVWQPPVYQLTRPYVIPVWGAQGQVPIYYPPQPIHPDVLGDPRKSYLPPKGYLPPTKSTTIGYDDDDYEDNSQGHQDNNQGGNIPLDNRNNFDDAPIWDYEPIQTRPQSRPQTSRPPIRTTPAPAFTQPRRTRRPGVRTTTPPSLVHRSENNTNTNQDRPNSLRPLPNRPQNVEVPSFRPGNSFQTSPRPVRPSTTPPPPAQPSRAQPSRCVWAIVSCCQGSTQNISYSCFEQLGCTGAFWDQNPCDSDLAKAAVDIALQYYSQK